MSDNIRVLVADDHAIVRAGLLAVLSGEVDIEVVGEAADGRDAVSMAAALSPDVVLMDLQMPRLDGVAAIAELLAQPDPPVVVVVTVHETDSDILRAVEAGATGYLLKDAPPDRLVAAIRAAHRGEPVLSPAVTTRLMAHSRQPAGTALTAREVEILEQVARGLANRDIARELFVSEATVKSHLVHVFDKLGVTSRTAAVARAVELGVIRHP